MKPGRQPIAELRLAARADQLQRVRAAVRRLAQERGCAPELVDNLVLAVNEACMNVIQHAYGPGAAGEIVLQVFVDRDELVFRLIDFAPPVDKKAIKSRDLEEIRPGGIGVHLICQVMDRVEFLECPEGVGNILEMRKNLKA